MNNTKHATSKEATGMLKQYTGFIIIDWRSASHLPLKIRTHKPKLAPYEIAVRFNIKVEVPPRPIFEIPPVEITIPEAVVQTVTTELPGEQSNDADS
ncbi:hypothetical protein ES706_06740 [subsurface metagenome]